MRARIPTIHFLLVIWATAVVAAMAGLANYQMRPGVAARAAPGRWPETVRVAKDSTRATLVMMLHPQCPCSRASVSELAILMAHAGGRVVAQVVFIVPRGAPANWIESDLWKSAAAIPGVSVGVDFEGTDAQAFGATTSGATIVYDANGKLLFSGG